MKLTDLFERVAVLTLPFKTGRRAALEKHLADTGIVDPAKVRWEPAVCGNWLPAPGWWGQGNGAWGCLLSHVRLVQDAARDNLDSYCVLEDDVFFDPRAPDMLARLWAGLPPDWDQIYLGGQHRATPEPIEGSPFVLRAGSINRTHAFALKREVFAAFHAHVLHAPDYLEIKDGTLVPNHYHIDHQLERAHRRKDWNTYTPAWWLCAQEAGESNISGRANPRLWWHPYHYAHNLPFVVLDSQPQAGIERFLHAGYNIKEGSMEDAGLDRACKRDEDLTRWLQLIAEEAIALWKLPAVQHPSVDAARVSRLWRGGVAPPSREALERLADYPFNGLFPHPLSH